MPNTSFRITFRLYYPNSRVQCSETSHPACFDDARLQQRNTICHEAIEGNAVHRAASTDETAAQRIERQKFEILQQLQNTVQALVSINSGDARSPHSNRCQLKYKSGADGVLRGVGSQFDGVFDPSSEPRHEWRH